VISIGYSDGLHRVLSGNMDVLVRGKRVPQVGGICMDMCMVDVTDVPDAQ
jgi:alanine racemase